MPVSGAPALWSRAGTEGGTEPPRAEAAGCPSPSDLHVTPATSRLLPQPGALLLTSFLFFLRWGKWGQQGAGIGPGVTQQFRAGPSCSSVGAVTRFKAWALKLGCQAVPLPGRVPTGRWLPSGRGFPHLQNGVSRSTTSLGGCAERGKE